MKLNTYRFQCFTFFSYCIYVFPNSSVACCGLPSRISVSHKSFRICHWRNLSHLGHHLLWNLSHSPCITSRSPPKDLGNDETGYLERLLPCGENQALDQDRIWMYYWKQEFPSVLWFYFIEEQPCQTRPTWTLNMNPWKVKLLTIVHPSLTIFTLLCEPLGCCSIWRFPV